MTETLCHLDYETRSRVDLLKQGVYIYAMSPTTEILWMAWAFNEEEPVLWRPGMDFPARVLAHLVEGARRGTHAHNAAFERLITKHVLTRHVPELECVRLEHWYCTSAQARARALPASLDNLGRCLGLAIQKDKQGKDLIRKLSIPGLNGKIAWENGVFNEDPVLMDRFGAYCIVDVIAERDAARHSPPLTEEEFEDYVLNEQINDRGIEIDTDFAVGALQYADAEMEEIRIELEDLTDGVITSARQFARIKTWIEPWMGDDEVRHAVTKYTTDRRTGETDKKISLDKAIRFNIMSSEYEWPEGFIKLVELLDLAGSTSVSKYQAMLNRAQPDKRLRGAYVFAGAGQTKRFSSTGAQLHNLRRDTPKNFRSIRAAVIAGRPLENTLDTLAACLRPTLRTDRLKRRLVGCDLSQIEARTTPWLAGCEERLEMYRSGIDVYVVTAEQMYPGQGLELRQTGKVAELALQFGGALKALQSMARVYRVAIDNREGKAIVDTWRENNRGVNTRPACYHITTIRTGTCCSAPCHLAASSRIPSRASRWAASRGCA